MKTIIKNIEAVGNASHGAEINITEKGDYHIEGGRFSHNGGTGLILNIGRPNTPLNDLYEAGLDDSVSHKEAVEVGALLAGMTHEPIARRVEVLNKSSLGSKISAVANLATIIDLLVSLATKN
ncbi:hypothetical protein HH765_000478 [Escherichia coli]|nr:hypothetical protein [Escherichia coli]MEE1487200.1 hypothetical protein [Shigella flexneri]EFI4477993.1 hypothetical protein [Escherichia coli]HCL9143315.1 hypothetical protein [Escherichia coli]HCP7524947.1 hypothetical protein [Escherichia coli]